MVAWCCALTLIPILINAIVERWRHPRPRGLVTLGTAVAAAASCEAADVLIQNLDARPASRCLALLFLLLLLLRLPAAAAASAVLRLEIRLQRLALFRHWRCLLLRSAERGQAPEHTGRGAASVLGC